MATRSFLTPEDFAAAESRLQAPISPPSGDESQALDAQGFADWLASKLVQRLATHPQWLEAGPIALGSWARGELAPKSDIDLIFVGSETAVQALVQECSAAGLKLRYRMPADREDWTAGVLPFDVLALLQARPLTTPAKDLWQAQLAKFRERHRGFRAELLRALKKERQARAERYDSIANLLEPNLKYGPGALRDLEQALVVRSLFPERFTTDQDHAFAVLTYYKAFFLLVRQKLHLGEGSSDVLAASEQKRISEWLGYASDKEFMREIQKGLSRVSFYADWVIARASSSAIRLREVDGRPLKRVEDLFKALRDDPSILMQNRVRIAGDTIFAGAKRSALLVRKLGRELDRFLAPKAAEAPLVALFRSRLIDHLVPDYRRVVGWVQHDQYHRFSVDAHLLQVLRELKRLRAHPNLAGVLAPIVKRLRPAEWRILAFASLYHDLAKGRGGDHADQGRDLAARDLKQFGFAPSFVKEVCWIVERHLGLSAAAFRENPRSPRVWRRLEDEGVRGRKILQLAVFTIVDIRGTNPEAWTPWKARLLFDLVQQLERPETDSVLKFAARLRALKIAEAESYLERLDPFLISEVPAKILAEDLANVLSHRGVSQIPRVVHTRRGGERTWLRVHAAQDRSGLFFGYVQTLARHGLAIRHASIRTDHELGVYDWFEINTSKRGPALKRALDELARVAEAPLVVKTKVVFDAIELIAQDEREWVISFRGRDQSGALATAAHALSNQGASVTWAKVHTWGRQIDDVIAITPLSGASSAEVFLASLKQELVETK